MSLTIDCGEGKHDLCTGTGRDVYLIPQESGGQFWCGCPCHHGGSGIPCRDPECPEKRDRGTLVTSTLEQP